VWKKKKVHGTSILKTENKGRQHNIKMYRAKKYIYIYNYENKIKLSNFRDDSDYFMMPKSWSSGTCQYLQNTINAVGLLKEFLLLQDTSEADGCSGSKSVHIPTPKSAAALCYWLFD